MIFSCSAPSSRVGAIASSYATTTNPSSPAPRAAKSPRSRVVSLLASTTTTATATATTHPSRTSSTSIDESGTTVARREVSREPTAFRAASNPIRMPAPARAETARDAETARRSRVRRAAAIGALGVALAVTACALDGATRMLNAKLSAAVRDPGATGTATGARGARRGGGRCARRRGVRARAREVDA